MKRGTIVVEGHGEVEAAANLITRLSSDLGLPWVWSRPVRSRRIGTQEGLCAALQALSCQRPRDGLLVLRDADDDCPARLAPRLAQAVTRLGAPFPIAIVLLHPEYEVLFLPCLDQMAGRPLGTGAAARPGLRAGTRFDGDPESSRGVKEWLSRHFPPGSRYKPSLDQLPMTRMIDFDLLRRAQLPCFGTLERALRFLDQPSAGSGAVYP